MFGSKNPILRKPIFKYLLIQTFFMAVALSGWNAIYTNFAVEAAGFSGEEVGIMQSIRELPGLFSVSLLIALIWIKEMRLMSMSMLMVALGCCLVGFFPSFSGILFCTLLMSVGFHYAEAVSQSLTLQHYSITEAPVIIGVLRSATSAGSFAVGLLLFALSGFLAYQWMFLLVGSGCLVAAIWGLAQADIPAQGKPQRHGLVFKRQYWLYYGLTLFSGARRQIFMVFSVLLLVERFGFSVTAMTFLFLVNNLINWVLNRYIGKAINAFGERKLLTVKYVLLTAVFAAYAFSENSWLVVALYVIEQLFFNFTVAIRTFFQKIAVREDIAPSMALGLTMNHVAAVVVPVLGGLLWMYNYRLAFYMGMFFCLAALALTQFIDKELERNRA